MGSSRQKLNDSPDVIIMIVNRLMISAIALLKTIKYQILVS